ncbi:hypothetical protein V865_003033 [Kwoniella europaea PYCC6329]|uniref:AGC-kinase C-terminal domain-containing protein n=1 Tax=Kwoniella europaea PYCC6329 TaxID=1423913 RepID=A0AAX4KEW8_9TREE
MTVQENKRNYETDHQVSSSTRTSEDGITVIGYDDEAALPTCYAPIENPTSQDNCNDSDIPSFHTYNSPPPYCKSRPKTGYMTGSPVDPNINTFPNLRDPGLVGRPDEVDWDKHNLTSDKMREFGYNQRGEPEVIDEDTIDQGRFISNFTGRLDFAPRWQYKFRKVASTASQVGEEEEDEQGAEYEEKLEQRSIKPIHAFLRGVTFGYPMLISSSSGKKPFSATVPLPCA